MAITDATNNDNGSMSNESQFEPLSQEEQAQLNLAKPKRKKKPIASSSDFSETDEIHNTQVPNITDELPEIDFTPHSDPVKVHPHIAEMNERMHSEYVPPLEEEKFNATSFTSPNAANNPNGVNANEMFGGSNGNTPPTPNDGKTHTAQPQQPNNVNPDLTGVPKKDARKAAINLWDTVKEVYMMLIFAAREKIKIPQSQIRKLVANDELTLNMAIPDDESPTGFSDITFEEWVNMYNSEAPKIFDGEEEFIRKMEEKGIIDYFVKKGWGLNDEQSLLATLIIHVIESGFKLFMMIKQRNFVINGCKDKHQIDKNNGVKSMPVSEDNISSSQNTSEENQQQTRRHNEPRQGFSNMSADITEVEILPSS